MFHRMALHIERHDRLSLVVKRSGSTVQYILQSVQYTILCCVHMHTPLFTRYCTVGAFDVWLQGHLSFSLTIVPSKKYYVPIAIATVI